MKETVESLVISAPAKVNLSLRILAKRSDGYHELDTVFQKLELADRLTVRCLREPGIKLSCPGTDLPEDESNLVWRAAHVFLQETGLATKWGLDVALEKRIPVAAGLGGGSSDAGSLLAGLNQLFDSVLSEETLVRLGCSLGADVPFFVVPHESVRATGIGDRMVPVAPLRGYSLILVNPGFSVSTAWVYENYTLTKPVKVSSLCDSFCNGEASLPEWSLYNDLEQVTIARYPEIDEIKRQLLDGGASGALMSGSGPTVFGMFPDSKDGDNSRTLECAKVLKKKYGRGVFVTRPLGD